jgi:hypothetical protein
MKRKKNVDFVRKSKKTNCYLEDVNWPNIEESFSVTNTYLGIGSPEFATVGVSDKYFKMNDYFGVNTVANSTEFILGQSTILTSVLSTNKHWLNINEAVTVSNTYLGVGTPQLATVNASDKYFNSNVSPSVISVANPTDLILGQSTIRTSVLSDNKNWINLNESVSPANTFWGVGSPQLGTIGASDKFFNMNPYAGLISVANSTDLTLGQSNFGTSLLSDMRHWSNIVGSVSGGNTSLKIASSQLATVSVFDEYSKMSINSNVNPTRYLTDFDLSQSVEKASLIFDNKELPSLVGTSSIGNSYISDGLTELAAVSTFDRYSNKSIYSVGNPRGYLSDYSLGKRILKDSIFSVNEYLSEIVNSSIADNFKCISVPMAQTKSICDSLIVDNIYSTGHSPLCIKGIDFGQSVETTDLYSISNYLSSTKSVIFPNESYSNIGLNKVSSGSNEFSFFKNINEVISIGDVTQNNNLKTTSNLFKIESRKLGAKNQIEKKFKEFLETINLDQNHFGLEFTADNYNFNLIINIMNCTINSNQIQFGNKYIN